jgi:hypothetical protein
MRAHASPKQSNHSHFTAVRHEGHIDYLHDGHLHHVHDDPRRAMMTSGRRLVASSSFSTAHGAANLRP